MIMAEANQNQPNPFSPEDGSTASRFSLSGQTDTQLQIFDISGRLVRELVSGNLPAGEHQVNWNGRDSRGETVSSGVYFYKLQTADRVDTRKMTLLK